MSQTFDDIDLCIANPPFEGTLWAKHLRHAQTMLNETGKLVAIVPTSIYTNSTKLVKEICNEVNLYQNDPLILEAGTFPSAPTTETRLIETRSLNQVKRDSEHKSTLINHSESIVLTMENTREYMHRLKQVRGTEQAAKELVKQFLSENKLDDEDPYLTKQICCMFINDSIIQLCARYFSMDKDINHCYSELFDLSKPTYQPNFGDFQRLLFGF